VKKFLSLKKNPLTGENLKDKKLILQELESTDSSIRRAVVEELISEELDNKLIDIICKKLYDEDKGVRDAVSQTLIFNQSEQIPEILIPYIASEDIAVRNLAGDILLKKGIASVPALVNYLPNGNADDKKFIIDILGLIGDQSVAPQISQVLKETNNDNLILACVEALGNLKCDQCFDELVKVYSQNELFKPTVIEAFGKMESVAALDFVLNNFQNEDELTKFSMLETLGKIGNEETFFLLLSELKLSSPPLNWAIIESLKNLKDKLQIDIPFDESSKNSLLNTLKEGELNYKRAASHLINYFLDRDIVDTCLEVYGDDYEIDENIKMNYHQEPIPFYNQLAGHLKSEFPNLRNVLELTKEVLETDPYESIKQLNDLAYHNICDALTELLSNADEEIRRIAMELLFYLNTSIAIMFIDVMTSDNNMWNRLRLIELIENENDERVKESLKILSSDEEEMVREKAISVLSQRELTEKNRTN